MVQRHYFMRQLSVATSCRLVYCYRCPFRLELRTQQRSVICERSDFSATPLRKFKTSESGSLSPWHCASPGYGWRVAANILNKQSRTADKGWSSSLGIGRGVNSSSPWKHKHVTNHTQRPRNRTDPLVQSKQWKSLRIESGDGLLWMR